VFQNNETAAILVYQENPVGIENFSHVKNLLLFQEVCIAADHVSENDLYFIKGKFVGGVLKDPSQSRLCYCFDLKFAIKLLVERDKTSAVQLVKI